MDMNKVILRGTIVTIRETTKKLYIRIATDGGAARGREEATDFPEIAFYDKNIAKGFSVKDQVTILGEARTLIYMNNNDKRTYELEISGLKIEKSKRLLAQYIEVEDKYDGGKQSDANVSVQEGTVWYIYEPTDNMVLVGVRVENEEAGRKPIVEYNCLYRQARYIRENLQKGDRVAIAGSVRTNHDEATKQTRQNLICLDIAKL